MENDFSKVKIGDKVFDILYGWCTVVDIGYANDFYFDIKQKDKCGIWVLKQQRLTATGRIDKSDLNPSVFWDEVIIIPPPKPKKKVEKIIEGWINIYPNISGDDDVVASSDHLYESQELADKLAQKARRLGKACHIIHKYTVEE